MPRLVLLLWLAVWGWGCVRGEAININFEGMFKGMTGPTVPPVQAVHPVKNVILVVGDGMGAAALALLRSFSRQASSSPYADQMTYYDQMAGRGRFGLVQSEVEGFLVQDSATAATMLATGRMTKHEVVGVDPNGRPLETILEKAKQRGLATGLVTDTRLTHATPAAFAAHRPHRSQENEIAEDMLEAQPDLLLGRGQRH